MNDQLGTDRAAKQGARRASSCATSFAGQASTARGAFCHAHDASAIVNLNETIILHRRDAETRRFQARNQPDMLFWNFILDEVEFQVLCPVTRIFSASPCLCGERLLSDQG
jgi:hypothetical protein